MIEEKTLSYLLTDFCWWQHNFCQHSPKWCSQMHVCHVNKNWGKFEQNCSSFLIVIYGSLNFKFRPTLFWKMYRGYNMTPLNSEKSKIKKSSKLSHPSYKLNFLLNKSNIPHDDSEGLVHWLKEYLYSTLSANSPLQSNIFMLKSFFCIHKMYLLKMTLDK